MKPLLEVAKVMALGASKYGRKNWRKQPIAASTYYSAALRHMIDWFESGVDLDAESGQHHLAHAIACLLITLDSRDWDMVDDRAFAEAINRIAE